ncbi:aluminum-activated malate transporter 10-like protein [Tanacetum coccineum]
MSLSSSSSNVMRELANIVNTMTRSAKIDMAVEDMKNAVKELQNDLKSLPDLMIQAHDKEKDELVPSEVTVVPLTDRRNSQWRAKAVDSLAESSQFKQPEDEKKPKQNTSTAKIVSDEEHATTALERV